MQTETIPQTKPAKPVESTPAPDLSKVTLRQWCLVVQSKWPKAEFSEYPGLISRLQGGRRFDKILEQHYRN